MVVLFCVRLQNCYRLSRSCRSCPWPSFACQESALCIGFLSRISMRRSYLLSGTTKGLAASRKQCFSSTLDSSQENQRRGKQIHVLCQQGLIEDAYFLYKEMRAMDMLVSEDVLYVLVSGLALVGHVEDAYRLCTEMSGMVAPHKNAIYAALLLGLGGSGHVAEFEKCYGESQASGFKISMKAFKVMVSCLVKSGFPRKAYDLYLTLKAKGRHPDCFILDSLIFAWAEGGEVDIAYSLLQELRSGSGARPELFNAVMKGYAYEKRYDDVLKVVRDMDDDGVPYNLITCNILIDVHGKHGKLADALRLYKDMKGMGINPDVFTFTTLIDILGRAKLAEEAYDLFKDMKGLGVRPSLVTYNALLKILGQSGHIQAASLIVEEMADHRISPDSFTFSSLIDGLGRANRLATVKTLFERIKSKSDVVDVTTYTTLIRALNRGGDIDAALAYFKEMKAAGHLPNLLAYSTMIDGLAKSGRVDEGYSYVQEMECSGCYPNGFIYNTLIHNCAKAGRRDFVKQLMLDMEVKGLYPDPYTYGALIDGYGKSGNIEEAEEIFRDLKQKGGSCLNAPVCNSMLAALIKDFRLDEALELFYEMPDLGITPDARTFSVICSPVKVAGRFGDLEKITQLRRIAGIP